MTTARVALPATRSISNQVAFRTAVPKNVSFSVSRLFTTSHVARYESEYSAPKNPPSPTIFVANIPWNTTEEELSEIFTDFGEVKGVRIHLNSEGRPRGIAHIDFVSQESAVATVDSAAQEPIHLAGRDLRIDYAAGVRQQKVTVEPSEKLYFSGLLGEESDIRAVFQQFDDSLVDIHLMRNPQTGARNPTGFLQFTNTQVATEVLETLNGIQTPDGNTLALSYARPRRTPSLERDSRHGSPGSFQGQRVRKSSPRWNNER